MRFKGMKLKWPTSRYKTIALTESLKADSEKFKNGKIDTPKYKPGWMNMRMWKRIKKLCKRNLTTWLRTVRSLSSTYRSWSKNLTLSKNKSQGMSILTGKINSWVRRFNDLIMPWETVTIKSRPTKLKSLTFSRLSMSIKTLKSKLKTLSTKLSC